MLELGQHEVNGTIMEKLVGHFPELSQQKFSSNVVEKCLKLTGAELGDRREQIVREIIETPLLPRLLQVWPPVFLSHPATHTEKVDTWHIVIPNLICKLFQVTTLDIDRTWIASLQCLEDNSQIPVSVQF